MNEGKKCQLLKTMTVRTVTCYDLLSIRTDVYENKWMLKKARTT